VLAATCVGAVVLAVAARLVRSGAALDRRLALGGAAAGLLLAGVLWYEGGPGAAGWAARAGTPASLLHTSRLVRGTTSAVAFPNRFSASLQGRVSETSADNGLVDVHLDGNLAGGVSGRLRVVLEGIPLDGGGVSMTSSGVAFAARGTRVFEGRIVGLQGNQVAARVTDNAGRSLELVLDLQLSSTSNALAGTVHGSVV
jgi:hypothetical protein